MHIVCQSTLERLHLLLHTITKVVAQQQAGVLLQVGNADFDILAIANKLIVATRRQGKVQAQVFDLTVIN
jgi:hypothetical protein